MNSISVEAERDSVRSGDDRVLLAVLLGAVFVAILDVAIANVALPSIGADFRASGAQLQLTVSGYVLAYAVLLITGARVGARYGHGRTFRAGVALFTAASLACGLAWSAGALIAFRVVEGVGAAAMVPQVISLVQLRFTGAARTRVLGWYAATVAGGAAAGQVLGGVLVQLDVAGLGWRLVFLVNVPVGALIVAAGRRHLERSSGAARAGLDVVGLVVLSAAVLAVVTPLVIGQDAGWPPWCWGSLAAAAVLLAVFVRVERDLEARGGSPLLARELLRSAGFVPAALAIFAALANYGAILFLVTLYVQSGLGHGPLAAGLVFLPSAVAFGVTSLNWRRLPERWHRPMIPLALLLSGIALVGLADGFRSGDLNVEIEFAILLFGTGMGLAYSPLFAFGLAHVPPAHAAGASGVLVTVNQLGQVVGVACYGAIYLALANDPSGPSHAASVTGLTMSGGAALAASVATALLFGRPDRQETR